MQAIVKAAKKPLFLFHCLPFEQVQRGLMIPDRKYSDGEYMPAYEWLGTEVGYFPLFLALGSDLDDEAVTVTGYQTQWSVFIGGTMEAGGAYIKKFRKAGEFPNYVVFGFEVDSVPVRSYSDYQWWNCVLTDVTCDREVDKASRKILFKKSWPESKWHRMARQNGHTVQVVAPELDLDKSAFIWVRNQATRQAMLAKGFTNVLVKRIRANCD